MSRGTHCPVSGLRLEPSSPLGPLLFLGPNTSPRGSRQPENGVNRSPGAWPQPPSVQSGPLAAESFPSLAAPVPADFLSSPCADSPLSCQGTWLFPFSQDRHACAEAQNLVIRPLSCVRATYPGDRLHCPGGHRAYGGGWPAASQLCYFQGLGGKRSSHSIQPARVWCREGAGWLRRPTHFGKAQGGNEPSSSPVISPGCPVTPGVKARGVSDGEPGPGQQFRFQQATLTLLSADQFPGVTGPAP